MNLLHTANRILKISLFVVFLFIFRMNVSGQEKPVTLSKSYNNLIFSNFVKEVEKNYKVHFYYVPSAIPDITIEVSADSVLLPDVLKQNLTKAGFNASFDENGNIFIFKEQEIKTELPVDFFKSKLTNVEVDDRDSLMNNDTGKFFRTSNEYLARTFIIGTRKEGVILNKAKITGTVKSAEDGAPIPGATIYVKELETGAVTDNTGLFQFTVPKGKYSLQIRSVGFEEEKCKIEVLSNGTLNLTLAKKVILMNEVTITSQANHNVRGLQMGFERMTIKEIKEVPVVLGERDIIKIALLLPGVKNSGEGSNGFNVRGSPADQNMFYINNVPVYNTSHLFGFFSAFNPDVVSDFTLYKSNIPLKYGGRLASIFEIKARQGNQKDFGLRGGISPITTRIMTEIPIVKEKVNFMIGFRSTYSDWILQFINVPEVNQSSGQFGDLVSNLSIQANKNNQFNIFTYASYDKISLASKVNNDYSNMGISGSWFHTFNPKHEFDFNLIFYKYNFKEENYDYPFSAYSTDYQLDHQEINARFNYRLNNRNTLSYGFSSVLYVLDNGKYAPLNDESMVEPVELGTEQALESGIFVDDEWKISPKLTISAGLRYNDYSVLGEGDVIRYQDNSPKTIENIIDTLHFSKNEIIKSYQDLNYRISANYLLKPDLSVKFSFNKLSQYIFMLSNTTAIAPSDKWKLCDYNIEPLRGSQISLGFYSNFGGGKIETSVEGYYKIVDNLPEYKDGAQFVANTHPEQDILQGDLDAYGLEFMIRKTTGKLNGWVNYSYSSSKVIVNNEITGEQTNFGKKYPANYDQPHSVNIVANYKFSKRLSISGSVVYSTGRPATYPTSVYYLDGQRIISYSARNEYRIPDYFRTDLSLIFEGNLKKKKAVHGSWIFSIYNLTGRNNAYSVYFKSENGIVRGYKMSIFATPIFSVTYDFKLGNYAN